MPDLDSTELRLRSELQALGTPHVDVEDLLAAGHRRARRRAVPRRAAAVVGVAGLVAVGVALAVPPRDPVDTVTDATALSPTPTIAPLPPDTPLGEATTWPGGPFDPIDGMTPVPDGTLLSDDQASWIHDTENRLIATCMAEQGYEWGSAVVGDRAGALPLYLSPDELRAEGYRYDWAAAAREFLDTSNGTAPETEGMTDEEIDAYDAALGRDGEAVQIQTHDGTAGTTTGGCTGQARQQLYGSIANYLRYDTLNEAFNGISRQLREHREYSEPLADWQACMAGAGFDVGDADYGATWIRQAGAAALAGQGEGQTQFTEETIPQIADADAACQESSGLYQVRASLLDDITQDIATDLGVDLDHYIAYEHALYQRAQQIP